MRLMHIKKMTEIYWPLEVLSRSVHFPNLSTAAEHVGISQSQLSRMLKQLESYFGYQLLDRKIKRKSMWTPEAHQLAEIFLTHNQRLLNQFQQLKARQNITELRMVCLEGVIDLASQMLHKVSKKIPLTSIRLDIFDLDELEERYLREEYDLMLSIHIPNRTKPKYQHTMGFQNPEWVSNKKANTNVYSVFEDHQKKNKRKSQAMTFVSNSLQVRRNWIEQYGGSGQFPSAELSSRGEIEVFLLALPSLPENVWELLIQ